MIKFAIFCGIIGVVYLVVCAIQVLAMCLAAKGGPKEKPEHE